MAIAFQCVCSIACCQVGGPLDSGGVIPSGRGGGVAPMFCIKVNIQKGGRGRDGGVLRGCDSRAFGDPAGGGEAAHDLGLLVMLRGCDWRTRHLIFNAWRLGRRLFFLRLMGPDELLPGRSAPVHSGRTIALPDAPDYILKPPSPRCRMRQLTLPELIRGGGGKTKVARGGGGKAKVARGGGGKAKVARGGGGKAKVAPGELMV
jgi:hypothetical protein